MHFILSIPCDLTATLPVTYSFPGQQIKLVCFTPENILEGNGHVTIAGKMGEVN